MVPIYRKNCKFTKPINNSPVLNKSDIKQVQSVVSSLLYYGHTIDNTILPALNEISLMQACPTEKN